MEHSYATLEAALAERDEQDFPATPEAWTLNDFDDLLYAARRSAAYPIGDEMIAYPS